MPTGCEYTVLVVWTSFYSLALRFVSFFLKRKRSPLKRRGKNPGYWTLGELSGCAALSCGSLHRPTNQCLRPVYWMRPSSIRLYYSRLLKTYELKRSLTKMVSSLHYFLFLVFVFLNKLTSCDDTADRTFNIIHSVIGIGYSPSVRFFPHRWLFNSNKSSCRILWIITSMSCPVE